jgi:hypothetical protein
MSKKPSEILCVAIKKKRRRMKKHCRNRHIRERRQGHEPTAVVLLPLSALILVVLPSSVSGRT